MPQQLTRQQLQQILQSEQIESLSYTELEELVLQEEGIADYAPDGLCQMDPRTGNRIVYNSARAKRPHDNRPSEEETAEPDDSACVVCQGKTTGVLDVAELSEGFTFINKNLFPVLYPTENHPPNYPTNYNPGPQGMSVTGFHFLQWTSSHHDKDWHNIPQADRVVVLSRLAALEEKLLSTSRSKMPSTRLWDGRSERYGFVCIFKNYGYLVGASLTHGHQQIGLSNIMPRRFRDNWHFEMDHGETFSSYMLRENPPEFLLRDYGPAVLLVPYFMRRPFDMMLLLKDTSKRYLHQLSEAELTAVAEGWHDAIRAIRSIMPQIGRETAYNVITNNGPGAGLYFEFLPYTQEYGGFEHLGLYICQGNPGDVASRLQTFLAD